MLDKAGFDRPVTLGFDEAQLRFSGSDGFNTIGAGYGWQTSEQRLRLTTPLIGSPAFCPSLASLPNLATTLAATPALQLQGE